MKIIIVLLSLTLANSLSFAINPFSKWQLDPTTQLNFHDEACFYDFESVEALSNNQYLYSDILTDKDGDFLYRFDNYKSRIEIKDIDGNLITEVTTTDYGNSSKRMSSILLPFYSQQKCFYIMLESENGASDATLSYFEIDFSTATPAIGLAINISLPELQQSVLAATINTNENGYFLALSSGNLDELIILELNSDGSTSNAAYQLDNGGTTKISSGKVAKFSPQGDKLIINNHTSNFHFYDFDNSNGQVVHKFSSEFRKDIGFNIRDKFAFSQNGTMLYTQSGHGKYRIHQFNLLEFEKQKVIDSHKEIWSVEGDCVDCLLRDFRLAPNNKIYVSYNPNFLNLYTNDKQKSYLGVINCPNALAERANFELLGIATPNYMNSIPHLQRIPSNFQATPNPAAEFDRFNSPLYFCEGGTAIIEGVDDPCGEHEWITSSGERIYTQDLTISNFKDGDAGFHVYQFSNCYQIIRDTFTIEMRDSLRPEIVLQSPDEVDLCNTPLTDMMFGTKEDYDSYEWFFTESGTTNRQKISTNSTVTVNQLGLLDLVVSYENGCVGIAEYNLEPPKIELSNIDELEVTICSGRDIMFDIQYLIQSNNALRIDSVKFRNNNNLYVINAGRISSDYPNGIFDKGITISYNSNSIGIERDTLEIYLYSKCYKEVSIPLKVITESNQYTLETPHQEAEIGEIDFEIPIYLTTSCIERKDSIELEATISLLKEKYFLEDVTGVNLVQQWTDSDNLMVKIGYTNSNIQTNGITKIGSLSGVVLLSDIDSSGVIISDISSSKLIETVDGSLKTDEICVQDLRQIIFADLKVESFVVNQNTLTLETKGNFMGELSISIFDYSGKKLNNSSVNKQVDSFEFDIDLSNLPKGLYFIRVDNGINSILSKFLFD